MVWRCGTNATVVAFGTATEIQRVEELIVTVAESWGRVRNMISVASHMESPAELMSADATLFGSWSERRLIRKIDSGHWRITPEGEAEYWAMRNLGDREREIDLFLRENITSVINDIIKFGSVVTVADHWSEHLASGGVVLTGIDLYRMLARWKADPPKWFDEIELERLANLCVECPTS